jgi:hypothetical protein
LLMGLYKNHIKKLGKVQIYFSIYMQFSDFINIYSMDFFSYKFFFKKIHACTFQYEK